MSDPFDRDLKAQESKQRKFRLPLIILPVEPAQLQDLVIALVRIMPIIEGKIH